MPQGGRDHAADRPQGAQPQPRFCLSRGNRKPVDALEPDRRSRWLRPSPAEAPRLAVWDDPKSGTLDARARAWLEINCAHCHNPQGPARNSGLDLLASQQKPTSFGIGKPPVAAGIGSGGLAFDIVPGQPDKSILVYRIASTHPGIMMPELGKRLVHDEGVALIREWIAAMPAPYRANSNAAGRESVIDPLMLIERIFGSRAASAFSLPRVIATRGQKLRKAGHARIWDWSRFCRLLFLAVGLRRRS